MPKNKYKENPRTEMFAIRVTPEVKRILSNTSTADILEALQTVEEKRQSIFYFPDLVSLGLVTALKVDGFHTPEVVQAVSELEAHWTDGDPAHAGKILLDPSATNTPIFMWKDSDFMLYVDSEGRKYAIPECPRILYNVSRIAYEVVKLHKMTQIEGGHDET